MKNIYLITVDHVISWDKRDSINTTSKFEVHSYKVENGVLSMQPAVDGRLGEIHMIPLSKIYDITISRLDGTTPKMDTK